MEVAARVKLGANSIQNVYYKEVLMQHSFTSTNHEKVKMQFLLRFLRSVRTKNWLLAVV